jgi:phage-related protein
MALPAIIAAFAGRTAAVSATAAGGEAAAGAAASSAAASSAGNMAKGLQAANQAMGQVTNSLGNVTSKFTIFQNLVTGLAGEVGGALVKNLTTALDMLKSFSDPIAQLVALHNPGRMLLFQRALMDAYATIGRMLVPVLDAVTRSFRKVGDLLAGMEPVLSPLIDAISEFIDKAVGAWIGYMKTNMGAIEMMIDALVVVVKVVGMAVEAFLKLAKVMTTFVRSIASLLGYSAEESRFDKSRTSRGAASVNARFVGAKEISDEAIKNALMQGAEGGKKKKPEEFLSSIDKTAKSILEWLTKKKEQVDQGARVINPAYGAYRTLTG